MHHVTLRRLQDYEFVAEFNDVADAPPILLDEPPPLGGGSGPDPVSLIGAAVGNCLASSLVFSLNRARVQVNGLIARVTTHVERNERGRLRITGIDVELLPDVTGGDQSRAARSEQIFEDFCTVSASVRQGIPINVSVRESAGVKP
jgi:uncharacterized OsmC-like protein